MLSAGRYGFRALGPRADDASSEDLVFGGQDRVVYVDRFGNLVTNVRADRVEGAGPVAIEVEGRTVALRRTYADVARGALLGYVGSFGLVETAARDASAAEELGVRAGAPVVVGPE